jgi:hypothetical protein
MPMGRRHGTHHLAQEAPYLTIFLGVEPVRFMPLVQSRTGSYEHRGAAVFRPYPFTGQNSSGIVWEMDRLDSAKIDRKALSVASLLEPSDENAYWFSRTPYERLQAAELMRQIVYGYDPSTTRLQRVLEIAQRARS